MTDNQALGRRGEQLAKQYLISSGYRIIAGNYHCGHPELDLIAQDRHQLVFVEVKTRFQTADSLAENPLAKWQTANLRRAILDYCFEHRVNLEAARLDLIVILVNRKTQRAELKHYRDVF